MNHPNNGKMLINSNLTNRINSKQNVYINDIKNDFQNYSQITPLLKNNTVDSKLNFNSDKPNIFPQQTFIFNNGVVYRVD